MSDHRREKRLERKVRVRLVEDGQDIPAVTDNVSAHGLKVRSGRRHAPQEKLSIVLETAPGRPPVRTAATVCWEDERPGPGGTVTRTMGVRFDDPPPEFFEQLLTSDGERLFDRLEKIQAMPRIVLDLMALLGDPSSSPAMIAQRIHGDQALAAFLLRLVNSPLYGFSERISSLQKATHLLGFVALRANLMTFFSQTLHHAIPDKGLQDYLWRHALAAALFAKEIARHCGENPDDAYVAGLLHDIGKAGLFFLDPAAYRIVMDQFVKHPIDFAEAETIQFGFSHLPIGALLLTRWQVGEPVIQAVRHHHRPDLDHTGSRLPWITAAANGLAHELGPHGHWAVDPWLDHLGIDPPEALRWTEQVRTQVREVFGT